MTAPVIRTYIDWDNTVAADPTHDFTTDSRARMRDTIMTPIQVTRGRSLDFSADMSGQLTFSIKAGRSAGCYPRQVLMTPGLVGYWHLGEASGTVVADIAGGKVGAYVATPTLGATGPLTGDTTTAVTLNGSTQHVTVPDSTALDLGNGPFTLAAWVKRSSTGTEDAIIGKGTNGYYLYLGSDNKAYLAKQSVGNVAGTTVTITDTSWHLVVATYAGTTTGKVYIDGVDRTTSTASQTIADTAVALGIGSMDGSGAWQPFAGSLAHAAIWNVALTQAQVTALYTAGTTAPIFPAYDKIGRGDVMVGRRILVTADGEPVFSGRIIRLYRNPMTYDIEVVCGDDLQALSNDIPAWVPYEGTFRELRMDVLRRQQTFFPTYGESKAYRNPNGGASTSYWTSVPVNRIGNPGFETNTTGWNITTDSECTSASSAITRTAGGHDGSWQANVTTYAGTGVSGAWYDLSAFTFKKDYTYRFVAWVKGLGAGVGFNAALYSNGTHADRGSASASAGVGTWVKLTGNWTPTADRTDVHFSVNTVGSYSVTMEIDSIAVWHIDSNEGAWYDLSYADPLCLSTVPKESVITRQTGTGPYGLGTFIRASAASGASVAMPFQLPGAWTGAVPDALETFAAGSWRATAWLKGSGTAYLRFGRQSDPAGKASSASVTLSGSWQQTYVTFAAGGTETDIWLVAETTGGTIDIGGVVIAAGTTTWDWCPTVGMDGLDTAEDEMRVCRVTPSGTPLDVLRALNGASFTHQWVEPLAAYPWYRYRTRCPSSLSGKSVAELYDDDVTGHTGSVQSFDSLINVVRYTTGTGYFDSVTGRFTTAAAAVTAEETDDPSIAVYGRFVTDISSAYLEPYSTALTTIPAYILDAYSVQQGQLSIVVENRWPSQTLRQLDDLVVVSLPRLGIVNGAFIIVGIAHDISATGNLWRTTYQLEAGPAGS